MLNQSSSAPNFMPVPSNVLSPSSLPFVDRHPSTNGRAVRALVVETLEADFERIRSLLQEGVTRPYETEWIANRRAAVEAIKKGGHDVVFLGYRLDEGTGLDVLTQSFTEGSDVPVILLTPEES